MQSMCISQPQLVGKVHFWRRQLVIKQYNMPRIDWMILCRTTQQ